MSEVRPGVVGKCVGASVLAVMLAACSSSGPVSSTPTGVSALSGSYVFTVTGTNSTTGDYAVTGSFVADGKGNITSAVADYNLAAGAYELATPATAGAFNAGATYSPGTGTDADVPLKGTYTVTDGTANISLTDGASVQDTFTSTLVTSGSAPIQGFDGTGSGMLYKQVTAGFTLPGTYTFTISGEGQGTVTGSGQFVAGTGGTFTGGNLTYTDAMNSQTASTVTGFIYPPDATSGRGQAALQGYNLSYYVIGPTQIQMIGLDNWVLLTIPAMKQ